MLSATQDSLQRAIDALGAVCVRDEECRYLPTGLDDISGREHDNCTPALYALTWDKRWYVTDAEGLELTRLLGGGDSIASLPVKMPLWWSPEQRFAWIGPVDSLHPRNASVTLPKGATFSGHRYLSGPACRNETPSLYRRITVDLETGEEIAA